MANHKKLHVMRESTAGAPMGMPTRMLEKYRNVAKKIAGECSLQAQHRTQMGKQLHMMNVII
jgi:hypothetical protein